MPFTPVFSLLVPRRERERISGGSMIRPVDGGRGARGVGVDTARRGAGPPPPELPAELSAQFDYPRALGLDASETEMRSRAWYETRRIDMAAVPDRFDARRTVVLDYYSPRGGSKN